MYITLYYNTSLLYVPDHQKCKKSAGKSFLCPKHQTPSIQITPPPTVSAGPTPSASAASTLPISSTGSDVEPADIGTEYQSNVDERNPIANSPDAILISDTSDVEYEDDGSKEVLIQVKKFSS